MEEGRILYVSSVDVSRGDGPGVNEREFIRSLYRSMGERARFVIPRPVNRVADIPNELCTFTTPHHSHHPVHYLRHMASQAREALSILRSEPIDLLVCRPDVIPIGALYLTRRTPVPYALKTLGRGEIEALGERGGLLGRILARPGRTVMRRLVTGAIVTDACSMPMISYLRERLGVPEACFEWIDNAVDIARFCPSDPRKAREQLGMDGCDPVIGYVGSRPSERGARALIEILPDLLPAFPAIGVLIVGDDPQLSTLEAIAERRGVRDRVTFTGYIPFDEVPKHVNALDIGVSISDSSDRFAAAELKVRQYLACGKPVVASPGSNDFLATESLGTIVTASDPNSISKAIRGWLERDSTEVTRFARRARTFVEERLSFEGAMNRRFEVWAQRLERRETGTENEDLLEESM